MDYLLSLFRFKEEQYLVFHLVAFINFEGKSCLTVPRGLINHPDNCPPAALPCDHVLVCSRPMRNKLLIDLKACQLIIYKFNI